MFDYSKLIGRIIEIFKTQTAFALAMGISEHSISMKLTGKRFWKQPEITKACEILNIEYEEIPLYFFTPIVQSA